MWMLGALLPSALMAAAFVLAGQAFRGALESSLDHALLAQGAAESASLFDRAEGPHLHMAESPLVDAVRPFAPTGELFDAAGRIVARFPPMTSESATAAPPIDGPSPQLATRTSPLGRFRELLVRVPAPGGGAFVLRLSASLAQVDASVRTFHIVAASVVASAGALLLLVQLALSQRLARRLSTLSVHLERIREGDLQALLEPDASSDEISALRQGLADTTSYLRRAQEAQERLFADAAHELRTPLTLMRTSLDLALRKERSLVELREALSDTRSEVDRLAQLATHLLEMAAAGRNWELREGSLSDLLDESTEAARAEAERRGLWFEMDCERPALAHFSPPALRMAVDNLIANALRFAPHGTPIEVRLRKEEPGHYRLSVSDAGPGVPEGQRETVFAPFQRIDTRGGSGLGLAIVAEVMRHHHGRAFIDASARGGARVNLVLPVGG
jgi:signal transduction histidine kinase